MSSPVYDHNNLYTMLADKLAVREYVASRTTRVKAVPLIGYTAGFRISIFQHCPINSSLSAIMTVEAQ